MGWSPAFLSILERVHVQLVFAVEIFQTHLGEGVGGSYGVFSSSPMSGALQWLDPKTIQVGGQSVTPQSWTYGAAPWRFALVDLDTPTAAAVLRKGTMLRLRAGLAGSALADMEIIQAGAVSRVKMSPGRLDVEVWDLVRSLNSRITSNSITTPLFYGLSGGTTLNANYTALPPDGTLTVISTSGFDRETGGSGMIKITPTTGDPFFLTYTGTTGTTFTGLSTSGQLGTVNVAAVTGDAVAEVAYLADRHDTMTAKILMSTGIGSNNSTLDTYPKSWGYALQDSSVVDHNDIRSTWGSSVLPPSSGSDSWTLAVEAEQASGISFLQSLLSPAGAWVTMRQGRLTVRWCQDIQTGANLKVHSGIQITDRDSVEGSESVEWFSLDVAGEFNELLVTSATGTTLQSATLTATLPAKTDATSDVSDRVFSNETAIREAYRDRLWPWLSRIPESITLTLAGCWWAQLCPGDIVSYTSDRLHGRLLTTVNGYAAKLCMVTQVTPDWWAMSTKISMACLPEDDADEWGV